MIKITIIILIFIIISVLLSNISDNSYNNLVFINETDLINYKGGCEDCDYRPEDVCKIYVDLEVCYAGIIMITARVTIRLGTGDTIGCEWKEFNIEPCVPGFGFTIQVEKGPSC